METTVWKDVIEIRGVENIFVDFGTEFPWKLEEGEWGGWGKLDDLHGSKWVQVGEC